MLYICTAVAGLALLLLRQGSLAIGLSLLFGLFGGAPAGVIMALTGEAMAPQRRAFGMGVFFSLYFVIMTLGPPLAGWLFDRSGDAFTPILFAVALFVAAALVFRCFRLVRKAVPAT
jgi:MFS family permease